ncbi:MAG TPA: hypothetical protein VI454_05735 [Verrucomicrobiae bacterium]
MKTWERLTKAARQAPADASVEAPFGFSNRVVARWLAGELPMPSAWEFLSLRSLGFAALVMLVSLAVSFNVVCEQFAPDPAAPSELVALFSDAE